MKNNTDNSEILDTLDFGLGSNAVSHNETTGLIPSAPDNEYEADSYKSIVEYEQKPECPKHDTVPKTRNSFKGS